MSPKAITINRLPWTHPDASLLRTAQQIEINGPRNLEPGLPPSSSNVPIFLIAYINSEPIACGGLRPLSDQGLPGQAEIKRMYVVPSQRGAKPSVAVAILEALESAAREEGWGVLKLETGERMGQARRFYEKCGFGECEAFGGYVGASEHSVFYEKVLL